jgi:hypothetical protein
VHLSIPCLPSTRSAPLHAAPDSLAPRIWAREFAHSRHSFADLIRVNLFRIPSFYDEIPPRLLEWIPKQKLFFVATAALRSKEGERVPDNRRNVAGRRVDEWGFVNTSPKEMGLFNVVNANNVWCELKPSQQVLFS